MNIYKYVAIIILTTILTTFSVNKALAHGDVVVMTMYKDGYDPKNLEIDQGETVEFVNASDVDLWPASNIHPTHEIYSEFDPKRPIAPGEHWEFTFDKAGEWKYHDHIYPNVKGTIVVSGNNDDNSSPKPSIFNKIINLILEKFINPILKLFGLGINSNKDSLSYKYDNSIEKGSEAIATDDDALYSHIKKFGAAETMSELSGLNSVLGDCHNRAHDAGRIVYELDNKAAFTSCSAECHSGCYHGATEAFFRDNGTSDLIDNIDTICGNDLNMFFAHQCYHGIGHGLMAYHNYEILDALASCDQLPKLQQSCYSGVFMENIVGGLAEEHQSEYLSEDPQFPCNILDEKYVPACYFYQSTRMTQLADYDFEIASSFCADAPELGRPACFESLGRDIGAYNRTSVEGAIDTCLTAIPDQYRALCVRGSVQDYFWTPQGQSTALNYCKLLSNPDLKQVCYTTIFYRAQEVLETTQELDSFCGDFEEGYENICETT